MISDFDFDTKFINTWSWQASTVAVVKNAAKELGVDYKTVSELLGHANVNITLNLYVHPRLSQKKKCIDLVCKVFQEKVI